MISFSHPVLPLIAGTNVSVICIITLDLSVNNVSIDVTWLRGNITLSNNIERVVISPLLVNTTSFYSILNLYPLIDTDNTTFSCQAMAYSYSELIRNSSIMKMDLFIPVSIQS